MLKKLILLSNIIILSISLAGCCTLFHRTPCCKPLTCEQLKCQWYKIVTNLHDEASCTRQAELSALRQQIICNHCLFEEDYKLNQSIYPRVTNPPQFLKDQTGLTCY